MTTEQFDIGKILSEVSSMPQTSEDINRIDPKVMTSIMAMAQAGQLSRIRKHLEDTASNWTRGYRFFVTDTQIPSGGFKLDLLGQAITIHNDGPNEVAVGLNNTDNPTVLVVNETLNIDFHKHVLELIYLKCDTGATTNVRATIKG